MSVNQESEQLAPHAAESFVSAQDATTTTGIRNKSVSGKSAKRRKVEVAEHMKYYKATAKRRALEVPFIIGFVLLLYYIQFKE